MITTQDVYDYIKQNVMRATTGNPRNAIKHMKAIGWEEKGLEMCKHAVHFIHRSLMASLKSNGKSKIPLTRTIADLGDSLRRNFDGNPNGNSLEDADLASPFIEAMDQVFMIDVKFDMMVEDEDRDLDGNTMKRACYAITPNEQWELFWLDVQNSNAREAAGKLQGITFQVPEDVSDIYQTNFVDGREMQHKVVDNIGKDRRNDFFDMMSSDSLMSLNKLQQTPLKINREILEVIERELSVEPDEVVCDVKMEHYKECKEKRLSGEMTAKEFDGETKGIRALIGYEQTIAHRNDLRRAAIKAEKIGEKTFYALWKKDWRGRSYPIEPYLSYQGFDAIRALFLFSEGHLVDDDGRAVMYAAAASLFNQEYGVGEIPEWCLDDYQTSMAMNGECSKTVEKFSFRDKVRWTEKNLSKIMAIAEDKIVLDRKGVDDPYQLLAVCLDIQGYQTNREGYLSHYPYSIDATCSGIQFQALLVRDEVLGAYVGLVPSDIPKDLYGVLSQLLVDELAERGISHNYRGVTAALLRSHVAKIVIMTRSYSAGKKSIAESLEARIVKKNLDADHGIELVDSMAISKLSLELLKDRFPSIENVLNFLQAVADYELGHFKYFYPNGEEVKASVLNGLRAKLYESKVEKNVETTEKIRKELDTFERRLVSGNGASSLSWTTPSGFNVVYEKYIMNRKKYKIHCDVRSTITERINMVFREQSSVVDRSGYASGIAPNFIHSLDASLLDTVNVEFTDDFISVHDAFAAHASNVTSLQQTIRQEMVSMFDGDLLDKLTDDILSDRSGFNVDLPEYGGLEVAGLIDCEFIFS